MDDLTLTKVEHSTVDQQPCGAGALLEVVVAVAVEQATHW
jgi:hypothetical protein